MFHTAKSLACLVALNLMPIKTFIALDLDKNNNKIIYGSDNTDGTKCSDGIFVKFLFTYHIRNA